MATAGSIVIDLLMKTGAFETDTARAEAIAKKRAKAMEQSFTDMSGKISSAVGGMFAGVGAMASIDKLVSVQREFDVLNSSLVTITGSTANAAREFSWIKDFAAETPFSLKEVTEAFVKMKALGLDASSDSLRSYGNTASAMGKGLNQMIEAVADAATGEFERLKEFGIKSKKQGDEVEFTFQNVKTTIGNNADEISKYLTDLGNNQFAGAMEERAKTLDGAISNLSDTWDQFFLTVSQSGVGNVMEDGVRAATSSLGALTKAVDGIDFGKVQDAAAVLAIAMGGRLVAGLSASALAFTAATLETMRYQAALASMAGVSAASAAGISAVAGAATVATRAMSLLGGPVGIAMTAAGTLAYFSLKSDDSKISLDNLVPAIDAARNSFEKLSRVQASAKIFDVRDALSATEKQASIASARIETLQLNLNNFPKSQEAGAWARDLAKNQAQYETLSASAQQYGKDLQLLQRLSDGNQSPVDSKAEARAEAYKKLMEKYATPAEKLAEAIKKAKNDLGSLYTPEIEKRLRENILDKPKSIPSNGNKDNPYKFEQEGAKAWSKAMEDAARMGRDATNEVNGLTQAQSALAELMTSDYWSGYSDDMQRLITDAYNQADATMQSAHATLALKGAREKETQAALDNIASLEKQIESAQLEAVFKKDAALAIEGLAIARLKEKAAVLEGFDGSEEQIKLINREIAAREQLLALGLVDKANKDDYWAKWLASAEEAMTNFDELAGDVAKNFSSGFGNAFEKMVFDSQNLGDAISNLADGMARSVINAIGQMIGQWLAYQAVQLLVGETTQSTGSAAMVANASAMTLMAGLNAFAATAAIPMVGPALAPEAMELAIAATAPLAAGIAALSVVGARADGGPVSQNQTYLVGERGPELFTPNTNGAIVPNNKLGGGGDVTVNLIEDKSRAGQTQERNNNGTREIDVFVADIMGDGPRAKAVAKAFGLQRRGY